MSNGNNSYSIYTPNGLLANTSGYDAFGNPIAKDPYTGMPISYNIGDDIINTKLNLGSSPVITQNNGTSSWWDSAKSGMNWFVGNKDFSPLGTFNQLAGLVYNIYDGNRNYKLQKDYINDQMNMARTNLGTSMGNAISSMANRAQMMSAWDPKAGSDLSQHSQDIADGLIQLAGNVGVDTSALGKFKNSLTRYDLLSK